MEYKDINEIHNELYNLTSEYKNTWKDNKYKLLCGQDAYMLFWQGIVNSKNLLASDKVAIKLENIIIFGVGECSVENFVEYDKTNKKQILAVFKENDLIGEIDFIKNMV